MSAAALDVAAVRRRFPSIGGALAYFDGPGGTQVPDIVIEAISGYLATANANLGGAFETSRETEALVGGAHDAAARFLGCRPDETIFGANMTTLNFALSRAAARDWEPGDGVVVTRLDHDANISPWLELARDRELEVRFADVTDDCRIDHAHLASLLTERTKVVAFPVASNAVGTLVDVPRIVELAHSVGALAWADAVHYAPHGPIDVGGWDVDVLICSPYKFYGPHLGLAYGRAEVLAGWRPYKVRPAVDLPLGSLFETGTLAHELLAGFVACVRYLDELGWDAIQLHERSLAERFLDGLTEACVLHGPAGLDDRVPTFAFSVPERRPVDVASALGARGYAVWHGNYYAVEIMERLGLSDGAVRVGIMHYNTEREVDGLLRELASL